jgi:hypothetical protein
MKLKLFNNKRVIIIMIIINYLPNIIGVIKERRIGWVENLARTTEMRKELTILIGKQEVRVRTGFICVWTGLSCEHGNGQGSVVNMVMECRVPYKLTVFLTIYRLL